MNCPLTGQPCSNLKHFDVSEVVNGQAVSVRLCSQCANGYFNMPDLVLLGNLVEPEEKIKIPDVCPSCKLSLDQIKKVGRLGCLYCYQHFGPESLSFLNKGIQEEKMVKLEHKRPEKENINSYIQRLHAELASAVSEERFETASQIKKQIEAANTVKIEKNKLDKEFEAALESNQFEEADRLKTNILALMKDFMEKRI